MSETASLLQLLCEDSCNRVNFLTSEDRSPSKNNLRGMLLRRSMTKQGPKPKRVKRSATKRAMSRKLFDALADAFSESELSEGASTSSSNPF
nr:ORF3 [Torque teno felis virus]